MHIPDGFVSPLVSVTTGAFSIGALSFALKKTKEDLEEKQVPLLGAMAAFIFAGQTINFYIFGGTSGHLIGAVLSSVIFGPWAAMIVMTSVLVIQCFVFQDGGIVALGANIFNMAVAAPLIGYLIYTNLKKTQLAIFMAGIISVLVAALFASLELAVSGIISLKVVLPAMAFWHFFIGLGEGLITVAVVKYLFKVKPSLKNSVQGEK